MKLKSTSASMLMLAFSHMSLNVLVATLGIFAKYVLFIMALTIQEERTINALLAWNNQRTLSD